MRSEKKRVMLVTIGIMFCFFLFGYFDALRGATLPDVMGLFKISYGVGGLLMVVHFSGYCSSSLLFSCLNGKLQNKLLPIITNMIMLMGISIYVNTHHIGIFVIGIFTIGFGLGLYEYAGNSIIVDIYPENKRGKYANLVAGMHGLGAISGPLLYGHFADFKISFVLATPVIAFVIILFLIVKYPVNRYVKSEKILFSDLIKAVGCGHIKKYYILSTLYIAIEVGIITWITTFLIKEVNFTLKLATLALSLFFVFLTIGRFVGSIFVDRIGFRKTLLIGFGAGTTSIIIGLILPGLGVVFLPMSGLFLSVIFPTLVACVSIESKEKISVSLGTFFVFAAIGGAAGSYVVGLISQVFGVRYGLMSTILFGIFAFYVVYRTVDLKIIKGSLD